MRPGTRFLKLMRTSKVLERLSDTEAQRSSEAVDTLKMVKPSGKHKRYKEFLYDVLFNSSPRFVLLCAVGLGQAKIIDMKSSDRVGLIRKIKVNKDDININYSTIESLATNYRIPSSVSGVFSVSSRRQEGIANSK